MGCLRAILCVLLPPLAVIDRGCGTFVIVTILTVLGWLPGVIAAVVVNLIADAADENGNGLADSGDPDAGAADLVPRDSDGDGTPDYRDGDSDNDGMRLGVRGVRTPFQDGGGGEARGLWRCGLPQVRGR